MHWSLGFFCSGFIHRIGAPFGYTRPYQLIASIAPRPVMLLHGTADDLVPIDHSTRLYACASEPKYLWLAKDAWHCALYDQHPEEYCQRVYQFINTHFFCESSKEESVCQDSCESSKEQPECQDSCESPKEQPECQDSCEGPYGELSHQYSTTASVTPTVETQLADDEGTFIKQLL